MNMLDLVSLVIFDFDGVLTDNSCYISEDGRETVRCNRSDGLGFNLFKSANLPTYIVSTESNPVVGARAKKLNVPFLQSVTDKRQAVSDIASTMNISLQSVMFVGNDVNDLSALEIVGFPVAVADSHPRIISQAKLVLDTKGGYGVVRELAEHHFGLSYSSLYPTSS